LPAFVTGTMIGFAEECKKAEMQNSETLKMKQSKVMFQKEKNSSSFFLIVLSVIYWSDNMSWRNTF
jgi:hypothetical protein